MYQMDVRGLVKLASGTERGEEKRVWQANTRVRFWDRKMRRQYFCQLWQGEDSDARNEIWIIRLPAWLSLVLWEEPEETVVERHYSVHYLRRFLWNQQSLVHVLGWIQRFSKFISFGGPCSDSRMTSVTRDQLVKPSQCTDQKEGGDAWHWISSVTSQVFPKATREF